MTNRLSQRISTRIPLVTQVIRRDYLKNKRDDLEEDVPGVCAMNVQNPLSIWNGHSSRYSQLASEITNSSTNTLPKRLL